jgi:hypothetical protein
MSLAALALLALLTPRAAWPARVALTIEDLARVVPAGSQVFLAFTPQEDRDRFLDDLKKLILADPRTAQDLQEVQKDMGLTLDDLFALVEPAVAVSLLSGDNGEFLWAAAVPVRDEAGLRALLGGVSRHLDMQPHTLAGVDGWASEGVATALARGYLVAGSPVAVEKCLRCLQGQASSLATTPHFRQARAQVPAERGVFVFLPGRNSLTAAASAMGQEEARIAELLWPFDYVAVGEVVRQGRSRTEAYARLDARSASPLAWALLVPPEGTEDLAGWFPQDVATYASFNFIYFYRPLKAAVSLVPPFILGPASGLLEPVRALLDSLGGRLALASEAVVPPIPPDEASEGDTPTVLLAAGVYDRSRLLASISRLENELAAVKLRRGYEGCQSNCKDIATALEMYATDSSGSYPASLEQLVPDYLSQIPSCPEAGRDTYSASYTAKVNPAEFRFYCAGHQHRNVGVGPDLPAYSSTDGLKAPQPQLPSVAPARTTRPVAGVSVYSYAEVPRLRWAVVSSGPQEVLLVAFGPRADGLIERALRARESRTSMARAPLYQEMLSQAQGTVVATGFVRTDLVLKGIELRLAPPGRDVAREVLRRLYPEDAVGYLSVEGQGLRWVSTSTLTSSVAAVATAVLVPNFLAARSRGQLLACKSNLKNIGTALEMYSTDNAGHYPAELSRLTPDYLRVVPTCPAARADTYSPGYTWASNPDAYTVICTGAHHREVPANYPQYNSWEGLVSP